MEQLTESGLVFNEVNALVQQVNNIELLLRRTLSLLNFNTKEDKTSIESLDNYIAPNDTVEMPGYDELITLHVTYLKALTEYQGLCTELKGFIREKDTHPNRYSGVYVTKDNIVNLNALANVINKYY